VVRLELVRTGSPAARVNIDPLDAVILEHWPREGCCYRRGLRDQVSAEGGGTRLEGRGIDERERGECAEHGQGHKREA
jgi:hypothetical protein